MKSPLRRYIDGSVAPEQINLVPMRQPLLRQWMLLSCLGVIAAAAACTWAYKVHGEKAAAVAALAALQAEQRKSEELLRKRAEIAASEVDVLNRMDQASQPWIALRTFAWDSGLSEVERINVPSAKLNRLVATPETGQMQVEIQADGAGTVLQVLQQLNENEGPLEGGGLWRVQRLQHAAESTSGHPVTAMLARGGSP
jgi:hypothetical protein